MKIRVLILIIITSITFFTNCSSDDNDSLETLNGTFNLTSVRGGNTPESVTTEFNTGDVIWTFDLGNNSLTVEYNIPFSGGINSGTYEIVLNEDSLIINDINQVQGLTSTGIITLSNNNLSIDFGLAADREIREFIRR
nr:lipocalin family protein [uncultured Psychroserpens sp.]